MFLDPDPKMTKLNFYLKLAICPDQLEGILQSPFLLVSEKPYMAETL